MPVALRVGVPLTSQRYDDSRYNRISIGGFDRLIKVTKYLGIACLTLAILSTLVLNIVSSYSVSNTISNAEGADTNVSTLADSSAISISFSNATGSCTDTSNPANVCMEIPDNGGIATGGHTVSVNAGSNVASYEVKLSSDETNRTALVNEVNSNYKIEPLASQYNNDSGISGLEDVLRAELNNTWAYSIDSRSIAGTIEAGYVAPIPPPTKPDTIFSGSGDDTVTTTTVYYGAKVERPEQLLAGNYTTGVVYVVTAELYPEPTVTNITNPNENNTSDVRVNTPNQTITIHGSNLDTVTSVHIDDRGVGRSCTIVDLPTSSQIHCTLPTLSTIGDNYQVIVETRGGSAYGSIDVIPQRPVITNVSPSTTDIENNTTTLTINGENFINVQYVYINFNENDSADDNEQCQNLLVADDSQLSCVAPEYNATGTYNLVVVTTGGASDAWRYSYVQPETKVARVEPSRVPDAQNGRNVTFDITGTNLQDIVMIELTSANPYTTPIYCYTREPLSSSHITCTVQWAFMSAGNISASFYSTSGDIVYSMDGFTFSSYQ